MARPETHADLSEWQRQGHLLATIPSDFITRHPSLGQHLLAAIAEADRLGLPRTSDGEIRIPKTDDELDVALRSEQRSWDYNAERWAAATNGDPDACIPALRYSVDAWAKAEGRDAVDWDALDAEAALR